MNVILTIISALFAFCCAVLIGSNRQKAKDEKRMQQYKTEAEAVIRESNDKAAKAKANEQKTVRENDLLKDAVRIVGLDYTEDDEELEEMAENARTDDDVRKVLESMLKDSEKRAEELKKRYEE